MPRVCRACGHPKRLDIDAALIRGESLHQIAARTGLSPQGLLRHRQHISERLKEVHKTEDKQQDSALLVELRRLLNWAVDATKKSQRTGNIRDVLRGIREQARLLELKGKATGELTPKVNVNIANIDFKTIDLTKLSNDQINALKDRLWDLDDRYTLHMIRSVTDKLDARDRERQAEATSRAAVTTWPEAPIETAGRPFDEAPAARQEPAAPDYQPRQPVTIDTDNNSRYSLDALDQARRMLNAREPAPPPSEPSSTPAAPVTPSGVDPWAEYRKHPLYGQPLNAHNKHLRLGIEVQLSGARWQPGQPRPPESFGQRVFDQRQSQWETSRGQAEQVMNDFGFPDAARKHFR
jgi:hypothetical protein